MKSLKCIYIICFCISLFSCKDQFSHDLELVILNRHHADIHIFQKTNKIFQENFDFVEMGENPVFRIDKRQLPKDTLRIVVISLDGIILTQEYTPTVTQLTFEF